MLSAREGQHSETAERHLITTPLPGHHLAEIVSWHPGEPIGALVADDDDDVGA
jgi:hypothetical protein